MKDLFYAEICIWTHSYIDFFLYLSIVIIFDAIGLLLKVNNKEDKDNITMDD